jgi:hypothetical protein
MRAYIAIVDKRVTSHDKRRDNVDIRVQDLKYGKTDAGSYAIDTPFNACL